MIPSDATGERSATLEGTRLTPEEERGKRIYLRGSNGTGREIKLLLGGDEPVESLASTLPCAGCHGHDGKGRPEGGVLPADIRAEALARPYEGAAPGGRKRPAYDGSSLLLALVQGRDSGGNKLSPNMPRYLLGREDAKDLLAYMQRLGTHVDPGIAKDRIRIGALLPAPGASNGVSAILERAIRGFGEDFNTRGGAYGRMIEIRFAACGATPEETAANVRRLLVDEGVFALVGGIVEGVEKQVKDVLAEHEVPLVGAITSSPEHAGPLGGEPPDRHVFYLFSGLREQAQAMVDFAAAQLGTTRSAAAVIVPEMGSGPTVAREIEDRSAQLGWSPPSISSYAPGNFPTEKLVRELAAAKVNVLFLLGAEEEQPAFLHEAARIGWRPLVLIPAILANKEITEAPASFQGRIYLSFPRGPSDTTAAGALEYKSFAARHGLPGAHISTQVAVYCAWKVFAEALSRAGRDLSREQLVSTLEGLYELETGLTPPITYGPNRRIGALGATMAAVDLEKKTLVPASGWLKVR